MPAIQIVVKLAAQMFVQFDARVLYSGTVEKKLNCTLSVKLWVARLASKDKWSCAFLVF